MQISFGDASSKPLTRGPWRGGQKPMSIIEPIQSASVASMPAGTEVFQHVGGAELRHPGIIEQIEVVLAGAALGVGEPLLERDAVFVLEELDVEAPSSLASGMILFLNGARPPSAKAPMTTLPPAARAGRDERRWQPRQAPGRRRSAAERSAAHEPLSRSVRYHRFFSLALCTMHDG